MDWALGMSARRVHVIMPRKCSLTHAFLTHSPLPLVSPVPHLSPRLHVDNKDDDDDDDDDEEEGDDDHDDDNN
eukprot:12409208-Karenia_brevis.AAC.1